MPKLVFKHIWFQVTMIINLCKKYLQSTFLNTNNLYTNPIIMTVMCKNDKARGIILFVSIWCF